MPIPNLKNGGISWVGTNAVGALPGKIQGKIMEKYGTDKTLDDLLNPSNVTKRRENNRANVYASIIGKNDFVIGPDWMTRKIDIY